MSPRRVAEEPDEEHSAARQEPEPQPAHPIVGLQRTAGNAAVTRMLAREPATDAPTAAPVHKPFDVHAQAGKLGQMNSRAMDKVHEYVDDMISRMVREGVQSFGESIPELIDGARQQKFKFYDLDNPFAPAQEMKVADAYTVSPADIEKFIRRRANERGLTIMEHRGLSDRAGVQKEALAALRNLSVDIPTSIEFGGDEAKIKVDISGTVKGTVKHPGGATFEVEGSAEGAKGTAKYGKGSVEVSEKGVKAKLKAGELVDISASIQKGKEGDWVYSAELQIGTLGSIITPEDIGKVIAGAQGALSKGATDLSKGFDPAKVKEHGGEMKEAVEKVVEKAKKSAAQGKPGWQLGGKIQGSEAGGISASVTLTWVF